MSIEKYGMPKAKNFHDNLAVSNLTSMITYYDKIIPLLDNDPSQEIQDIGYDLRDNLQNLKRIRDKIEATMVAGILDGTERAPEITNVHLGEMDRIFNKYNIK